ncbi:MAG: exo 1,3/1,4-beta-D-glucan glucohydrolase [Emcibacter sp.]|nr:exo 1,3/1,4-beta-D-glucan glucohydrolase [Emcibacter sp.]
MNKISLYISILATITLSACSVHYVNEREEAVVNRANMILTAMTLEEKVGQIIQADISAVTPDEARKYNLGAILNGGNSAPNGKITAPPKAWITLADKFWRASTDTTDGGVGIPVLWGTDAVHGHNNLQSATIFPHNSGLGATHDPELIKKIGEITASEIRATGIDWTFAPTLAVARDDRWGRTYESYSENPDLVAQYAKAMILGLQGNYKNKDFLKNSHVIATAKHFIGDGGTQFGIDRGDTIGDIASLIKIHGAGYGPAFKAHVQTVMASFSSINGEKIHGSKTILTNVLRGQMGFDGFVIGDWNGHAEVPNCTPEDCLAALNAGIDMYMAPNSWKGLYESLLSHAQSGELDMARLNEAVTRILKVKIRAGLFEAGLPSERMSTNPDMLGKVENRSVARQAVRKSIVLLKNQHSILPIKPGQNVLVTGSGANSMQQQTGGWTLSWQGDGNDNEDFKTGETIFSGIQRALSARGGKATFSPDGTYKIKPDVAIVVYGEKPYAEYRGDRSDLVFEFQDGKNLALIKSLKEQNIPVISIFLTGRPLWVNPHINASDAFVVAWLPGTEGGGIADVLIARKDNTPEYDFRGKLSFSWPANGIGIPINTPNDPNVLFPYGYGLTYADKPKIELLPENSGVVSGTLFDGKVFSRGEATNGFKLYLGDSSNWNTPATTLNRKSLGGGITIKRTDFKAQEDSQTISWSGSGLASFSIRPRRPINLTQLGNPKTLVLTLQWRIDNPVISPLHLSIECGEGCGSTLDISTLLINVDDEEWITTEIPVRCFVQSGLLPEQISTAIKISSKAKAQISLYAITYNKAVKTTPPCPPFVN